MNPYTFILLLLFTFPCSPKQEDCITTFENQLTAVHSQLLADLTQKFGHFITGFDDDTFANNYRNFLTQLTESDKVYENVPRDLDFGKKVIQLDTMIFKYDFCKIEGGEQRRFIQTHIDSDYISALTAAKDCNNLIGEYVLTIQETGGISPALLASGVSQSFSDNDFNNPVLQRILAVELFLPFLSHGLEEERR